MCLDEVYQNRTTDEVHRVLLLSLLKENIWAYIHCQSDLLLELPLSSPEIPGSNGCCTFTRHSLNPCGLLHHHRAVHAALACSFHFGKLFGSIIFFKIYFISADIISLKTCLKFLVVG